MLDPVPFSTSANIGGFGVGSKVVGVLAGGQIELFGAIRSPVWTEVSTTAAKGATSITLKEAVQWIPGDGLLVKLVFRFVFLKKSLSQKKKLSLLARITTVISGLEPTCRL